MKRLSLNLLAQALIGLSVVYATARSTSAAVIQNGWQYAIDVSYDSLDNGDGLNNIVAGGTTYEAYGIAIKDDIETNTVWVGINSNLPVTGNTVNNPNVPDGNIGWGDLLFEFVNVTGGENFKSASDSGQLWAIRFAEDNDSDVSELGVYRNVTAKSVVPNNNGWSNLYNNNINGVFPRANLNAWMGDLRWNDSYYTDYNSSQGAWTNPDSLMLSNIASGEKIGDITLRSREELESAGFDPSFFFEQGSEIFGFSFEKPLGFVGNFIATLLSECINDGMAILGNILAPEPDPKPEPEDCPVTLGQIKALTPDLIDGEWKRFYDVASHKWYDPPAYMGFEFKAENGTLFTQISSFPCGISADRKFDLFVPDDEGKFIKLGKFNVEDKLNFEELISGGLDRFRIIFDNELESDLPFSLQLEFAAEIGDISIRELTDDEVAELIPEPSTTASLFIFSSFGFALSRFLKNRRQK